LPLYAGWPRLTLATPDGPVQCFVQPGREHTLHVAAASSSAGAGQKRGRAACSESE